MPELGQEIRDWFDGQIKDLLSRFSRTLTQYGYGEEPSADVGRTMAEWLRDWADHIQDLEV